MRSWGMVGVGLLGVGCLDSYELARQEKLAQLSGCGAPLGTKESVVLPSSELVSGIEQCASPDGGAPLPTGFVTITGRGGNSVYGDPGDPWNPNDIAEPSTCAPSSGDFSKSRAFWNEVHKSLRAQRIVFGEGTSRGCDAGGPAVLSLTLLDWSDLGLTVTIVENAMIHHDVCSPVVVEVSGLVCL